MKLVALSVVLSVFFGCTASKNLPSFIEKCSISNNFGECFVKHANAAILKMLDGNKEIKLPSFNPLLINEVIFSPSDSLKIQFTNLKVSGFDNAKVIDAHYDKKSQKISFTLQILKLSVQSKYNATGKILILPIEGEGPCQIQLVNPRFSIQMKFDNFNAESTENIKLKDLNVEYNVDKTIYNFENLFNGNKQLGDNLNKFLNENEAELRKDFSPVFSNIMQSIVENLLIQILGRLTYNDVFLP